MSNHVTAQVSPEHLHEEMRTAEILFSGTLAEGVVSGGAVALAIIALAGGLPELLLSISAIALGASLFLEGAAITARFHNLLTEITNSRLTMAELGGGTSAESLAGIVGIVLGILSLLGLFPLYLIPAAIIAIGGCAILGAGLNVRLNAMRTSISEQHPLAREIAREAVLAATGLQVLVGIGAITLGILALTGIQPMTLSLVGILGLSGSIFFSSSAIAGRMSTMFIR